MNIGDKRAQICAMGFIPVAASVVKNMPGVETIQVSGEWTPIPVSSGEFKEKNVAGELTEQELKAVVTDTGLQYFGRLRAAALEREGKGCRRTRFLKRHHYRELVGSHHPFGTIGEFQADQSLPAKQITQRIGK